MPSRQRRREPNPGARIWLEPLAVAARGGHHPAIVLAAMNTSLPVLLYIENAVFWVNCQFDKPNGSARSLGPFSIPSLGDGVMLGTAWIDRPVDTQDLPLLPRPP